MDWITHPLAYYLLLASGLSLSLYLFVSVKKEIATLRLQLEDERRQTAEAMEQLRTSLARLESTLEELGEPLHAPTSPTSPPPVSMNIGRRGQALRMHRRGESVEQIATALQMPRSEVELLLKVQRAVMGEG